MALRRKRDKKAKADQQTVDPADLQAMSEAVLDLATAALGGRPAFADAPEPVLAGFGPGAYKMRLAVPSGPWSAPLIARDADDTALNHEVAWLQAMRNAGVAVPTVVAGPPAEVLVFEQPAGVSLAEKMLTDMPGIPARTKAFAELHARLHALPAAGFTDNPVDPLDELRASAGAPQVGAAVANELGWLAGNRPPTKDPVPCHCELNPVHVYLDASGSGVSSIVSWGGARLADPEYDVAATVTAFWSTAVYLDNAMYRKAMKMARDPLIDAYLNAYREASSRPLDEASLRYWRVHHLTRLLTDTARNVAGDLQGPWDSAGGVVNAAKTGDEIRAHIRELING